MNYDLIAIDLDGTLLQPDQTVHPDDAAALHAAAAAGVHVLPCTGRLWQEAQQFVGDLPFSHGVFATGAMVQRMDSGELLDSFPLGAQLGKRLLGVMEAEPFTTLLLTDPAVTGAPYLAVGGEPHPISHWWFDMLGLHWVRRDTPTPADLATALRVTLLGPEADMARLAAQMRADHNEHVELHVFPTLKADENGVIPWILELFNRRVNKWQGLLCAAERLGVDPARIAVIGDQDNDLPMIRQAPLSVAMGNAIDPVKAAARQVTRANTEAGVGHAVRQMLAGHW